MAPPPTHPRETLAQQAYAGGLAHLGQGKMDLAVAHFRQALHWRPDFAEAYTCLGIAFGQQKRFGEAEACSRAAVRLRPDLAEAHNNLAGIFLEQRRLDEALESVQRAVQLRPDFGQAQNNRGTILWHLGRYDEALTSYAGALRTQPHWAEVHRNRGHVLKDLGRLDEAIASLRAALQLRPDAADVHSYLLMTLHYHPGYSAEAILAEARRWDQQHGQPRARFVRPHANAPDPERRLRIGYVSPDFCQHPVSSFALPLLANHDHRQYEIHGFANVARPDAVTDRLRGHADVWHDIRSLSDEQVVELIRREQIDILVDLAMHTGDNRLLVFVFKPAPVQATWLAYPGTTGLSAIDYRLTDPYFDPPGPFDVCYAEASVRLADTFWCYDPLMEPLPVTPPPAVRNGYLTFGCLNNFCKVNDGVLSLWARVLQAVPQSRLLLLVPKGEARDRVLARLRQGGIAAERVQFADKQSRREYFQQYQQMDVNLDPFPCNGGTTSLDGFWMGVPTVTLVGQTAVGRAGWSQLCNLGLQELAAQTPEDYVRLAAELAGDLLRLQELRGSLRQRMERSPLMDAPRFARQVEQAYRQMWRQWCQGRSPHGP